MRCAALLIPVVLLGITGCGATRSLHAGSAASRSSVASDAPAGDRAPHLDENTRYRERMPVAPAARPALESARADLQRRLERTDRSLDEVTAAVASVDRSRPWIAEDEGAVVFEAEVDEVGCLIGSVPATGAVVVSIGGFVEDGGCHALTGH